MIGKTYLLIEIDRTGPDGLCRADVAEIAETTFRDAALESRADGRKWHEAHHLTPSLATQEAVREVLG